MCEEIVCVNCGAVVDTDADTYAHEYYCEECYQEKFRTCDDCGEVCEIDDMTWLEHEEEWICDECIRRHYTQCDDCGRYERDGDTYRTNSGADICVSCYADSYFTCEGCSDIFHNDQYATDGLCDACEAEREAEEETNIAEIKNYSYKPAPVFYQGTNDSSNLYMGIELEYETERGSLRNLAELWGTYFSNEFYLKHDGSLDHGLEAVSHPATLTAWHERRDTLESLFNDIESDTETFTTDGTGLHIHVSKRGMTDGHKMRLYAFINGYKTSVEKIARREESSWAKIKGLSKGKLREGLIDTDRYQALNWNNESTVEFRFFQSTLDLHELYTAIEFCHAAYSFTKKHVSIASLVNGTGWKLFAQFVSQNTDKYSALHRFLNELE